MGETRQAAVRREEILDKAAELFRAKGFLHTTTGDLIGALGISRGLLYYHFRDMEDVADHLIERWVGDTIPRLESLPFDRERSASEKLEELLGVLEGVPRGEDPWLLDRLRRQLTPVVRKVLLPILREGEYDGRFHVEDDTATADFLSVALLYGETVGQPGCRALVKKILGY